MSAFLQNRKNPETEIFVFCVITFEPIDVQTHSAPQNDRLNLSFVKDMKVVVKEMVRNGRKTAKRAGSEGGFHRRRSLHHLS